jgi:hypothetical protein
MSIRVVISNRLDKALGGVTFSGLISAAIAISIFGGMIYAGVSAMIANPDTTPEQREFAQILKPLLVYALGIFLSVVSVLALLKIALDIRQEAQDYARNMGAESSLPVSQIDQLVARLQDSTSQQVRELVRTKLERGGGALADTSDPEKLFQVGRQRLLDEAVRIDKISRRNLVIGIAFSFIALGTLAWPLIAQGLLQAPSDAVNMDVMPWFTRNYLPRFAVGLLLQFVGFFFLRLYVANELDLKHNKNELTNIELIMMGIQLSKDAGNAASRKDVIKSLMNTERNFLIKKNEKSVSTEALTEYNDLKGLIDKLVSKIPGVAK